MKLITWNVNGIRAVINKGALNWTLEQSADVVCLQETKGRPEQVDKSAHEMIETVFPATFWNPAERPGYSGTTTWCRVPPLEVSTGLGVEEFDREGRVIRTRHPGFLLYNIYFPNGGSELKRVPFKLDFYARLLEECDALLARGEQIILCGDFNTSHQEIDLAHPKQNANQTGFLPEEREWVTRFLDHGFVDAFRSLYPDRVQYTWWTMITRARERNVGWRLDYFLVSKGLMPRVRDSVIYDQVPGSDHCPVSLELAD